MSLVRKAEPKDLGEVIRLYKAGLEELGHDYLESAAVNKVITSFYLAPCFLLVINDNIRGMIGLTVKTISHNGVASLADYMFYIEPEHRNNRTLGALVKSAQDFAKSENMPLRVDFTVNNDLEKRSRLMEMHGFKVSTVSGVYNGK